MIIGKCSSCSGCCQNANEFGDFQVRLYPDPYTVLAALTGLKWPSTHDWLYCQSYSIHTSTIWWVCTKTQTETTWSLFSLLDFSNATIMLMSLICEIRRQMQSDDILQKYKKEKTACCCGWGDACQRICRAFLALLPGSEFDLYKMPPVFIKKGMKARQKKWPMFCSVIWWWKTDERLAAKVVHYCKAPFFHWTAGVAQK